MLYLYLYCIWSQIAIDTAERYNWITSICSILYCIWSEIPAGPACLLHVWLVPCFCLCLCICISFCSCLCIFLCTVFVEKWQEIPAWPPEHAYMPIWLVHCLQQLLHSRLVTDSKIRTRQMPERCLFWDAVLFGGEEKDVKICPKDVRVLKMPP